MAENICVNRVMTAGVTEERAQEILSDMAELRDEGYRAGDADPAIIEKMKQAAKEKSDDADLDALRLQRELSENIIKADQWRKSIDDFASRKETTRIDAMKAKLHELWQSSLARKHQFNAPILQWIDVEKPWIRKRIEKDVSFQEDIVRARHLQGEGKAIPEGFDLEAWETAAVFQKNDEFMRMTANDYGANIGEKSGYGGKHWHDTVRIAANLPEHLAMLKTHVDWMRSFDWLQYIPAQDRPGVIDDMAKQIQNNLAKGLSMSQGIDPNQYIGNLGRGRRIATSLERHRILDFVDADKWIEYNRSFGQDGILGGMWENADRYARIVEQLRVLGTKPESSIMSVISNYKKELSDIKAGVDTKTIKELDFWKKQDVVRGDSDMAKNWRVVSGQSSIPENVGMARAGSVVRNLNNVRLLGQATLSSLSDPIIGIMTTKNNYGYNIFQAWGMQIGDFFKRIDPKLQREMAGQLEAVMDGVTQYTGNRFEGGLDAPGRMSKMAHTFFKVSGLTWWTNNLKRGAATRIANMLGEFSGKEFGSLNRSAQRTLKSYGLDKNWDVIRKHMTYTDKGKTYVLANRAENIPDNVLDSLIGKSKLDEARLQAADFGGSSDDAVARLRRQQRDGIEMSVRTMMAKEIDTMTLTPDSKTQMWQTWGGTQSGTGVGEAARSVMQFKSFPIAFIQKVLYPMLMGDSNKFLSTHDLGNRFLNTGLLIGQLTAAGYAVLEIKRMAKGEKPYFMSDKTDWKKVAQEAMMQGGGLGLFGDFLFAEVSRFGGGQLETLAGPTVGMAGDALRTWSLAREGELKAADALNLAINYTPYANVFYIRGMLNYGVIYSMQEALTPGWMKKREQRMKQEGREFIYPPSRHALKPIQRIQEGISQ